MWLFVFENSLVNIASFKMVSNIIGEITYLEVESFYSAIIFHRILWYGWAFLEMESLNICHSVVYMDYGDEVTHISLRVIPCIHMNKVDVYNSTFISWKFCAPLECLYSTSDPVTVDTSVKWLQKYHCISERLCISQYTEKVMFMVSTIQQLLEHLKK